MECLPFLAIQLHIYNVKYLPFLAVHYRVVRKILFFISMFGPMKKVAILGLKIFVKIVEP